MTEPIVFRAGKCDYDEQTGMCTPKPMKGKIVIKPSEEAPGFYDFEWSTKEKCGTSVVEPIEFILIPGETKWVDIKSAKDGRLLCLLFSTGEKWFFWLQQKHQGNEAVNEWSEDDKELLKRLQQLVELNEMKDDEDTGDEALVNKTVPEHQEQASPSSNSNAPITHLSEFLSKDILVKYIESLDANDEKLKILYDFLPHDVIKNKTTLLKCVRGPFFDQAVQLLDSVSKQEFAGHQLSETLGYPYVGEGPVALLKGLRLKGKNEEENEKENY